jgi:hypothetical protein
MSIDRGGLLTQTIVMQTIVMQTNDEIETASKSASEHPAAEFFLHCERHVPHEARPDYRKPQNPEDKLTP